MKEMVFRKRLVVQPTGFEPVTPCNFRMFIHLNYSCIATQTKIQCLEVHTKAWCPLLTTVALFLPWLEVRFNPLSTEASNQWLRFDSVTVVQTALQTRWLQI